MFFDFFNNGNLTLFITIYTPLFNVLYAYTPKYFYTV